MSPFCKLAVEENDIIKVEVVDDGVLSYAINDTDIGVAFIDEDMTNNGSFLFVLSDAEIALESGWSLPPDNSEEQVVGNLFAEEYKSPDLSNIDQAVTIDFSDKKNWEEPDNIPLDLEEIQEVSEKGKTEDPLELKGPQTDRSPEK